MPANLAGHTGLRPPPSLSDIGLLEYLEFDLRPTFILDIGSGKSDRTCALDVAFGNSAFQQIIGDFGEALDDPGDREIAAFVSWAKDDANDLYFAYRDHTWSAVTVATRWRVISGTSTQQRSGRDDPRRQDGAVVNASQNSVTDETDRNDTALSAVRILDFLHSSGTISHQHYSLIRDLDWAKTPLGPMAMWPRPLVHALSLMFSNPAPCIIIWGHERTMIYNELYANVIQKLHPAAMGVSAKISFAAIWSHFENMLLEVEQTKQARRQEAGRTLLDRSGCEEEAFFTYLFMPLFTDKGRVCGVFAESVEVTKEIIVHRQMNTLFSIGNSTALMTTLDDFWRGIFDALQMSASDLPFVAVYTLDNLDLDPASTSSGIDDDSSGSSEKERWHLAGSIGFPKGHPATIQSLDLSTNEGLAPALKQMLLHADHLVFDKNGNLLSQLLFSGCVDRGTGTSFSKLTVSPLSLSSEGIAAAIIIGTSPLRPYDDEYARFINLFSRIVEDTAKSVLLIQRERRRLERTVQQAEYQRKWLSEQLEQQTKEARQSEMRFYNFAEQAPVGVYILDSQGQVKYSNYAWRELVGVSHNATGPAPWRTQVHPDDLEAVDQQWKWLTEGRTQSNFEWRTIVSSGENDSNPKTRYLRSSCFPELAEDGSMESVTGILMDVSNQKMHEQAIAEQLTIALEAKRARENFIDMVSHEIRNPLNAMLQCAEEAQQLLAVMSESQEALEVIETIQYCGRHQKHIIDDVLTISKLDSNLLALSPEEVMPVSILERVAKIFTSDFRAGEIEVTHQILGDCSTHCVMDASRVLQIMINLVGNACKFLKDRSSRKLFLSVQTSSEKPHLANMKYVPPAWQRQELSTSTDWGSGDPIYVHYSVTDTGPGLTTEDMSSLFARFKQASPRTHAQYGGSGLGLFISRQLAEMHGGRIGISSDLGQGSTFAFYIKAYKVVRRPSLVTTPRYNSNTDPMSISHSEVSANGRRPSTQPSDITILIVEDNLVNQKVLQRQLKRIGFQILTANHGEEALSIVQSSCLWCANTDEKSPWISIILCDLEMPVMDGLTCVSHIRRWQREGELAHHIPMIAVTGNARAERLSVAMEAGFDQVVTKPYSVPDLVPLIQQLVA